MVQFLKQAQKIYSAGGFVPKELKAADVQRPDLDTSISLLDECSSFFNELMEDKRLINGTKAVRAIHGSIYNVDIECLNQTTESMAFVKKRLELLSCNVDKCMPHTILNESAVEHAFGRSTSKNGTYNKNLSEYVSQKMKNDEDFFYKICEVPFSNPNTYRKRYSSPVKTNLHIRTIHKIFEEMEPYKANLYTLKSLADEDPHNAIVGIMKDAERVARSQPRRTNRSKWKQSAGYKPMLLVPADTNIQAPMNVFDTNDVVATYDSLTGSLKLIFVDQDVSFNDFYLFGSITGLIMDQKSLEESDGFIVTELRASVSQKMIIMDRSGKYFTYQVDGNNSEHSDIIISETFLKSLYECLPDFITRLF